MADRTEHTRLLTFRSGGWVLLLAGALTLALVIWALSPVFLTRRAPGDGRHPETYGFDLSNSLIPRTQIVAAMPHRDSIRALDHPDTIDGSEIARRNAEQRGKYLVSSDRVVGVSLNGESRAYPVQILNVHEVVNDTLGGVPVAVTYSPLCDSVVVFDRRVDDAVVEFGISGLVCNSNLLMYDRRSGGDDARTAGGESLWSQLRFRAVTGPAAAQRRELRVLPAALVSWQHWLDAHPDTTVIEGDPAYSKRYKKTSYERYFETDELLFPVEPLPPSAADGGLPLKAPLIVMLTADGHRLLSLSALVERSGGSGTTAQTFAGAEFVFHLDPVARSARVATEDAGAMPGIVYVRWFAWHAMHPQDMPSR